MENKGAVGIFAILSLILVIASAVLYFLVKEELYQNISLSLAGFFLLLSIIFLIIKLNSKEHKIKKKLININHLNSLNQLKNSYKEIYEIYMKLSEKDKQNYYHKITKLRGLIEDKMHADKKLELLVKEVSKGSIEEKKRLYKKINENFQKLPLEDQKKYSSHLVHLKEEVGEVSLANTEDLKNDLPPPQKNGN